MISYNRFTLLLKKLLLDPLHLIPQGFDPPYSTKIIDFKKNTYSSDFNDAQPFNGDYNGHVIWCHEEPLNGADLDTLFYFNF